MIELPNNNLLSCCDVKRKNEIQRFVMRGAGTRQVEDEDGTPLFLYDTFHSKVGLVDTSEQ